MGLLKQEGTKTRYSYDELREFKDLILKKLKKAKEDLLFYKNSLSHRDGNGTDDTSPVHKDLSGDGGSESLSKEETTKIVLRLEKYIKNLNDSLVRIENGSYGICRETGLLIPKERLRAVPHATLSVESKN